MTSPERGSPGGSVGVDAEGRFSYPWGVEIARVPRLPRGDPAELVERNRDLGIHSRTCAGGFPSLPGDFTVAASVDELFEIERRVAKPGSTGSVP